MAKPKYRMKRELTYEQRQERKKKRKPRKVKVYYEDDTGTV